MNDEKLNNRQLGDSTSKLIFGDAVLCAQFMRDFLDIPILKNVRPEDIEDVSQRFVPLFTSEREADTIKKVKLSETESLFFITLIDHKTQVDYNAIMQLFRYMCYIWEDYEKEVFKKKGVKSTAKDFKYPPILPIVYYEGRNQWTAVTNFKERIFLSDVFEKYIPDFSYEIIAKITTALLFRLNVPEAEVDELVGEIKERNMPVLFEHFEEYDIQAVRKAAREEACKKVKQKFSLTDEVVKKYFDKYWN